MQVDIYTVNVEPNKARLDAKRHCWNIACEGEYKTAEM